jgi:fatty acid desaturase
MSTLAAETVTRPAPTGYGHAHDYFRAIPDRIPVETLRELSRLSQARALAAVAAEWLCIALAVWLCQRYWHPALYPLALLWIGARQHALTVLGHDAVHYRFLRNRAWNDWLADLFLWWPTFHTTQRFRSHHGEHHRYLGTPQDGNIKLWRTHTADGEPTREWSYPKTPLQLVRKLLWRGCGVTGIVVMAAGILHTFWTRSWWYVAARTAYYLAIAAAVTALGAWPEFVLYWLVPFWTWYVASNYIRLICEHSEVCSPDPVYALTRTTLPTWLDRLLIVPRNISYHLEHHLYPSVPFYRLPELHAVLMRQPGYRGCAHVTRGVWRALRECVHS